MFKTQIKNRPQFKHLPQTIFILIILIVIADCTASPSAPTRTSLPIQVPDFTLESPYQGKPTAFQYKAQTHAHSYIPSAPADSPVSDTAEKVEIAYRDIGYDILFLTNHNVATEDPNVGCDSTGQNCILHVTSGESGWACWHHLIVLDNHSPLKLSWQADDLDNLIAMGILDILLNPASIISTPSWISDWISECNDIQGRINKFTNDGSLVIIAHPQASMDLKDPSYDYEELVDNSGYVGVDIFSGGNYATEYWDRLLYCQHPTLGFAADDMENTDGSDFNIGWIVVSSNLGPISEYMNNPKKEQFTKDILDNIKAGNFYSVVRIRDAETTPGRNDLGPRMSIGIDGKTINVLTDQLDSKIRFIGGGRPQIDKIGGNLLTREVIGGAARYTATGLEGYIRVEVEQQRDGITYVAYSQPILVKDQNQEDQGVDGHLTVTSGGADISFTATCRNHKVVNLSGAPNFHVTLPAGLYTIHASDGYAEYDGEVTVPISGYVDLGNIVMTPKPGLQGAP